jgi:hypothetical protein
MALCVASNSPISIRGSTTIIKLLSTYPDGRASRLMAQLGWECTYCSARKHEPLSLAAKRHGNPIKPVIACFRSLAEGGPDDELLIQAKAREKATKNKWQQHVRKKL